ncbi:MAG: DUF2760 domain-containing protein [Polyangiaceae bacterium]
MADLVLPFSSRIGFAFAAFFRILFDGVFAQRLWSARELPEGTPAAETLDEPAYATKDDAPSIAKTSENTEALQTASENGALILLSLLQREGRLIDFLEQEIASFSDADVGAAARAVHEGARAALQSHVTVEPIRKEDEGAKITLEPGFDANAIKLTGNVRGAAPHVGTLKHPGWRATEMKLPRAVGDHDARILAAAEVEL